MQIKSEAKESSYRPPSLSPSPPTFHLPSPIPCDTSDVWALSEWVWWWRCVPLSIVGNARLSLHCRKYEVRGLQHKPKEWVRWKFLSFNVSVGCRHIKWHPLPHRGVAFYLQSCARGAWMGFRDRAGMCSRRALDLLGLLLPSAGQRETLHQHKLLEPWWNDIIRMDQSCTITTLSLSMWVQSIKAF